MTEREGVVKYRAEHREEGLEGVRGGALLPVAAALSAWRHPLRALGWIGREAGRYEGYGFGNLSARVPSPSRGTASRGTVPDGAGAAPRGGGGARREGEAGAAERPFLVTGSQTGGEERLGLDGFALVERWDLAANRLWSRGRVAASSESLTHAALYQASDAVGAVFHVHAEELWREREALGLAVTDPAVPYGTPEMAAEVVRAWRQRGAGEGGRTDGGGGAGLLAMGGHEDGLLAWGRTPDGAGRALLDALLRLG